MIPTSLKEQKPVKRLEEQSIRLVDCTQNLLAGGTELLKESDNVVRALSIETRGGFI